MVGKGDHRRHFVSLHLCKSFEGVAWRNRACCWHGTVISVFHEETNTRSQAQTPRAGSSLMCGLGEIRLPDQVCFLECLALPVEFL